MEEGGNKLKFTCQICNSFVKISGSSGELLYIKYFRCPDIIDNNFEFMWSKIVFYKVDLVCAENVKAKHTRNDLGIIPYSNTIYFSGMRLGNSGYLITQWQNFVKEQAV